MAVDSQRCVIYTCITNDYDELMTVRPSIGLDYVCFTDGSFQETRNGWTIRRLPPNIGRGAFLNRYVKMHPHELLREYMTSIYVDGNVQVLDDPRELADAVLNRGDIALYEHPFRFCVYREAAECSAIGYDWAWRINRQLSRYEKEGYPRNHGLYEANVIIRRHLVGAVQRMMEAWWHEYQNGVRRDQLSLPYVSWKYGVPIVSLGPSDIRSGGKYFQLREGHVRASSLVNRGRGWMNRMLSR